jgi:drug/metabolite transporter (DMT)-like permease
MDPEVVLALLSSASFAASHVVSKRGLQGASVTAGFMVVVGCAWIVVSIPALIDPPDAVSSRSLVLFAVSGLFAPAVSRAAALAGVHALGPSVSVPIQQGLRPLIVLPAAAVLLGEAFGPLRGLGVALIVAGGWFLSREPGGGTADVPIDPSLEEAEGLATPGSSRTRVQERTATRSRGFRPGIVYPVVAALGYAASDLLVKSGLDTSSDPAFGATVSIGVGFLVWSVAHALPSVRRRFRLGRGAGWLVLSGALMGMAILLLFDALDQGDVSVVAPVVSTQPLWVFLFSALILRHMERRDPSMVAAGVVVVIGTVLVSL